MSQQKTASGRENSYVTSREFDVCGTENPAYKNPNFSS